MAFPEMAKVGWWIFAKNVTIGWIDRGPTQEYYVKKGVTEFAAHAFCSTKISIGIEDGKAFQFCPRCLVKVK